MSTIAEDKKRDIRIRQHLMILVESVYSDREIVDHIMSLMDEYAKDSMFHILNEQK